MGVLNYRMGRIEISTMADIGDVSRRTGDTRPSFIRGLSKGRGDAPVTYGRPRGTQKINNKKQTNKDGKGTTADKSDGALRLEIDAVNRA